MITNVTSSSWWNALPKIERDLLVCAMEASGILPHARQHDTEIDQQQDEAIVMARAVLALVDRGWITVHRLILDPECQHAVTYGPAIARTDLDDVLADADAGMILPTTIGMENPLSSGPRWGCRSHGLDSTGSELKTVTDVRIAFPSGHPFTLRFARVIVFSVWRCGGWRAARSPAAHHRGRRAGRGL
jgi:hypothetical protein